MRRPPADVLALRVAPLPAPLAGVRPAVAVGAAATVASALLGALVARNLPVTLGLLAGVLYTLLVLNNLPLGTAVWIALSFFEADPSMELAVKSAGILLAFAWIGTLGTTHRTAVRAALRRHGVICGVVGALAAWMVLSLLWSDRPSVGPYLFQWPVAAVVFVVVVTALRRRGEIRFFAAAFVAAAVLSVLVGLATDGLSRGGRLQGGLGDPNFLAGVIVAAIVLAAGLLASYRRPFGRGVLIASGLILAVGLAATESRGAAIASLTALTAALILFPGYRLRIAALALCGIAVFWLALGSFPGARDRLTTFNDPSASGRAEFTAVGWLMWRDHPVTGVGVDNYTVHAFRYAPDLVSAQKVDDLGIKVMHNSYVEMGAEAGWPGFLAFVGIALSSVAAAWLAARRLDALGDVEMATLARALCVALVATLVTLWSVSNQGSQRVWALFAAGPAILALADRDRLGAPVRKAGGAAARLTRGLARRTP